MTYIKLFLIALPIFSLLDFLWLGVIMSDFYRKNLGPLARTSGDSLAPYWPSAIAVYIILVLGAVIFTIPFFKDKPINHWTFLYGALFGFIAYGIYDLTNHATLNNWPAKVVIVDMLWGAIIYGTTTYFAALIARYFNII